MADAKLTALTAASALAGADLYYISQGGVSKKATHNQLLTLVGTTYVPLAGGTMTGALRISTLYTDASNYERLTLTGVAGTSVNITAETLGTGGDNLDLVLTPAGAGTVKTSVFAAQVLYAGIPGVTVPVVLSYNGNIGLSMGDTSRVSWSSNSEGQTAADTGFARNAAGIVEVNNGTAGTWRDLKLRNLIQTEYTELTEMTAPAAPATNGVRIFAQDNGAGKTQLMVQFATGAAQEIKIEP